MIEGLSYLDRLNQGGKLFEVVVLEQKGKLKSSWLVIARSDGEAIEVLNHENSIAGFELFNPKVVRLLSSPVEFDSATHCVFQTY